MNAEQIKKVESLIKEYHDAKKIKKDVLRNEIFQIMYPVIKRWINAIFSHQKIYLPKEELTAKTWDCFLYGLQYYVPKREIPVPNHFYTYTKFYLRIMQKEEIIKINKINRQALTDYVHPVIDFNPDSFYNSVDELKVFREQLSKEYKDIFDDAVMSMLPANKDKLCRIKDSSLSNIRYQESKKIFKIIIDFLLKNG